MIITITSTAVLALIRPLIAPTKSVPPPFVSCLNTHSSGDAFRDTSLELLPQNQQAALPFFNPPNILATRTFPISNEEMLCLLLPGPATIELIEPDSSSKIAIFSSPSTNPTFLAEYPKPTSILSRMLFLTILSIFIPCTSRYAW